MDAVFAEERKGDRKKMIEKFVNLFLPGTYHEVKNLMYMFVYVHIQTYAHIYICIHVHIYTYVTYIHVH